ncbi:lipoprotein [Metabacillus litoralis]|uniref:lipoprotein n=1 Tax=Metabacillus litoralis TaxID=152268 RepID=UPI001CFD1C9B|nr:lipoprotein [Metabacillus litoralis]
MKRNFIFLFILFILTGCTNSETTIPKEFEDFIPAKENEYYVVGYENENNSTTFFQKSIKEFKADASVSGLTIYYKVDENFKIKHEQLRFDENTGFIILQKDKTPYYVDSYHHFLDEK